jgi:hypothetical protein
MLMDSQAAALARFHRRGTADVDEPWHGHVRAIVAELGGDALLSDSYRNLQALLELRPDVVVVPSEEGRVEATYAALLEALS